MDMLGSGRAPRLMPRSPAWRCGGDVVRPIGRGHELVRTLRSFREWVRALCSNTIYRNMTRVKKKNRTVPPASSRGLATRARHAGQGYTLRVVEPKEAPVAKPYVRLT